MPMRSGSVILILLLVSMGFAGSEKPVSEEALWQSQIEGTYTGTLFASGYDMPVETTFYYQDDTLLGEYVMDEQGTLTAGVLTDITIERNRSISCTWVDKYGSGPASFTFTHDSSGFAGWWGTDDSEEGYQWWGSKEDLDLQQVLAD